MAEGKCFSLVTVNAALAYCSILSDLHCTALQSCLCVKGVMVKEMQCVFGAKWIIRDLFFIYMCVSSYLQSEGIHACCMPCVEDL